MPRASAPLLLSLVLSVASAAPAGAAPTVVVVPTGKGDALVPTATLARALAAKLRERGESAKVAYQPPQSGLTSQSSKADAETAYNTAVKAFEMLDFANVRKSAGEALGHYKNLVKAGSGGAGYVKTLHLLAAACLFDGDNAGAFKAMNDAVIFSRTPPSKKRFNPTVQGLYRKVVAQSRDEHAGSLKLSISPPAVIWLNGRFIGPATGTLRARAGLYLIDVYRPGHVPWLKWFRVRVDKTRALTIALKKAPVSGESGLTKLLRREAKSSPGAGVQTALGRFGGDEIVLLDADPGCTPTRCTVRMRRGKGATWTKSSQTTYTGDAKAAVDALLGGGAGTQIAGGFGQCTNDTECGPNERCIDAKCSRPSSIVRKWWFWTLIGVAAGGVAAAIAIPLSRPDGPVIEVR
ncbi:MAG: hypothetical protein KC503_43620 [Myxococcales bacterium]|nr:hypothetical protein [Myxococcales bacterium]